jgi:hypothetical protein
MATRIDSFYVNLLNPALDNLSQRHIDYVRENASIQVSVINMAAWVIFKRPAEKITQESPHVYTVINTFSRSINPSRLNQKLKTWADEAINEVFNDSPQCEETFDETKSLRHLLENNSFLPFAVHLHLDLFNEDGAPISLRFARNLIDATKEETS